MRSEKALIKWIEAGYEQFAAEGLEGIQVDRLARIVSLNKSGYYHYFGDREGFVEELMKHHIRLAELFAKDMSLVKEFDPDFIFVLLKYPLTVMVHMQLVRNRHDKFLFGVYTDVNRIVDPVAVRPWAEFIDSSHDQEFALRYFEQVRDMFYSRITMKTMNYAFLRDLLYEARELLHTGIISSLKPRK